MSVREVLDVMSAFRRKAAYVRPNQVEHILNAGYGLDGGFTVKNGHIYSKGGLWQHQDNPSDPIRAEASAAEFLPDDMEVVALVNSPLGPQIGGGGIDSYVAYRYKGFLE